MEETMATGFTNRGALGHTWATWECETYRELMRRGRIQTEPLSNEIWPITRWEEAFQKLEALDAHEGVISRRLTAFPQRRALERRMLYG
jgi:hypothetical protein